MKDRRFVRSAGLAALVACCAVLWISRAGWNVRDAMAWLDGLREFLAAHPLWLFLALVVLPGLPIPSSVVFLMAGAVWGDQPALACGYAMIALFLGQTWTYVLAAGPARGLVAKLARRFDWSMPALRPENVTDTLLVVRLVPGIPLFLQNYLLGLLRVPYRRYAWVSLVCNGPPVVGFVLAGAGIAGGEWKIALTGIAVIVLAVVVVRMIRRRCRMGSEK